MKPFEMPRWHSCRRTFAPGPHRQALRHDPPAEQRGASGPHAQRTREARIAIHEREGCRLHALMGRTSLVPVPMACTTNMIRFHGVFAPNARLHSEVVPSGAASSRCSRPMGFRPALLHKRDGLRSGRCTFRFDEAPRPWVANDSVRECAGVRPASGKRGLCGKDFAGRELSKGTMAVVQV
jgi:hypothetical protein